MTIWAEAYKTLPGTVTTPLMTLLGYLLWAADLVCVTWLIVGAGRYFALRHSTVETYADAHNGIARSLIAAVLATSAMAIATALTSQY